MHNWLLNLINTFLPYPYEVLNEMKNQAAANDNYETYTRDIFCSKTIQGSKMVCLGYFIQSCSA